MALDFEGVEKRMAEINSAIDAAETMEELDGLKEELGQLNLRMAKIMMESRKADMAAVSGGAGIPFFPVGEPHKIEVRNTKAYIDAYAEYIKTGRDIECRSLLTENVDGGTVPVPDFVYDIIKTAWDNNEIMSLVEKVELKGNLKVNFEISGTDAVIHTEGSGAVTEEELNEGIITLVPAYIKKWKSFSDEVMSLRGEAFVRYIYDEIAYRIMKKMADTLIGLIAALPQTATATSVSANIVKAAPEVGTVAAALGQLSDEATNPTIVMNKQTWAVFKAAQYANGFNVDPFEGFDVHFNNSLPAYGSASEDDVYAIVGDFRQGAIANFPNGQAIEYTFDQLTRKKEDLVEVLGKVYVAVAPVADKAFTLVTKPATI